MAMGTAGLWQGQVQSLTLSAFTCPLLPGAVSQEQPSEQGSFLDPNSRLWHPQASGVPSFCLPPHLEHPLPKASSGCCASRRHGNPYPCRVAMAPQPPATAASLASRGPSVLGPQGLPPQGMPPGAWELRDKPRAHVEICARISTSPWYRRSTGPGISRFAGRLVGIGSLRSIPDGITLWATLTLSKLVSFLPRVSPLAAAALARRGSGEGAQVPEPRQYQAHVTTLLYPVVPLPTVPS